MKALANDSLRMLALTAGRLHVELDILSEPPVGTIALVPNVLAPLILHVLEYMVSRILVNAAGRVLGYSGL